MTGRVLEIDEATYEADKFFDDFPTLRSSVCWKLIERGSTAKHAWYASPRLNPNFEQEHRKIFDKGAAAHALLLGKGKQFHIIKCPNFLTKEAKTQRDEAYVSGKIPLLEKDFKEAVAMADAAKADAVITVARSFVRAVEENHLTDAGSFALKFERFAAAQHLLCDAVKQYDAARQQQAAADKDGETR